MTNEKELNIVLNGTACLIERFPMPKKTESGLLLPESYVNSKEDVNQTLRLDPYQKRGRILRIGISCSEKFRENFKEGDIIHFSGEGVMPVPLRKDVYVEESEFALINEWAIHWKECDKELNVTNVESNKTEVFEVAES